MPAAMNGVWGKNNREALFLQFFFQRNCVEPKIFGSVKRFITTVPALSFRWGIYSWRKSSFRMTVCLIIPFNVYHSKEWFCCISKCTKVYSHHKCCFLWSSLALFLVFFVLQSISCVFVRYSVWRWSMRILYLLCLAEGACQISGVSVAIGDRRIVNRMVPLDKIKLVLV